MSNLKIKKSELLQLIESFLYPGGILTIYLNTAYKILDAYAKAKNEIKLFGTDKYFHYLAFYDCAYIGVDRFSLTAAGMSKEIIDYVDMDDKTIPEFADLGMNSKGMNDGAKGVDPAIQGIKLMPKTTSKMIKLLETDAYSWVFDTPGFKDFYNKDIEKMPNTILPRYNVALLPSQRKYAWDKKESIPDFVNDLTAIGLN